MKAVPKWFDTPQIPKLQPGSSGQHKPHLASAATCERFDLPTERPLDWQTRAVAKLGELVDSNRSLKVAMDACMRCGACADKCHFFLGTGDPKNMPVARQDLLRSVYKRYFTRLGRWFPAWVGARDLDEKMLEDWQSYFNQCSQCRRCATSCPIGIDTSEFSMAGRQVLASIGMAQRYTHEVLRKALDSSNNLGMSAAAMQNTLSELEDDIREEVGVEVEIPLDRAGAEWLLIAPSADFFAEPQVDGLIGYAKILHAANVSWTLSSAASEAANFALFEGREDAMRELAANLLRSARELGVKGIVFGECGHAWRVARNFFPTLKDEANFLEHQRRAPSHIAVLTDNLLRDNRIKLDPRKNDHRVLTFHDSCNVARASSLGGARGDQFEIPRRLLRAACDNVVDMRDDTIREKTFCCGGGGGLLTDELLTPRINGAAPRMQAFKEVVEKRRVTHLVAMCAICKTQMTQVLPHYGFEFDQILSLHQVVGDAVVLQ